MAHIAVPIILCSLFLPREILAQQNGSLTIFTVPETWSKYVGPGRYCESSKLSVRIDNGDTVRWPRKQRVQIQNLALKSVAFSDSAMWRKTPSGSEVSVFGF